LRLASFNLENLSDGSSAEVPLPARLEVLKPQLKRLNPDIICFQEVDATKTHSGEQRQLAALDRLLDGSQLANFHQASTTLEETGAPADRHNLVTLSRWPINRTVQYANDLVATPRYATVTSIPKEEDAAEILWDRPILAVEIKLPDGRTLHILNVHFKAQLASVIPGQKVGPFAWKSVSGWAEGYFVASIKRAGQALECRMVVDHIFDDDPSALIAVAGDFNSDAREVPLRIISGSTEDTGNGALARRSLALLEHSVSKSQRFTVVHRGHKLMMDHILVSRQLMADYRSFSVHNEMLGDELVAYTLIEAAPDSFHAPIVAEFAFD